MVTSVHDGTADLDVRGKRMRASVRDLRVVAAARSQASPARVSVNVELQPRETTSSDLNVIGCTVDEAITRAERFLDESLLTDQRVIRLIHGYGTGQLKRALTGFLQQHPLVARFATAPPEQGGGGVTVVELEGLKVQVIWAYFPSSSSTTFAFRRTSCRSCRSTSR